MRYDMKIIGEFVYFYKDGLCHKVSSENPFTVELDDGGKVVREGDFIYWYNAKDEFHRDGNLPAIYSSNGDIQHFYVNNHFHSLSGPALHTIEINMYYIMDVYIQEQDFCQILNSSYGIIYHV